MGTTINEITAEVIRNLAKDAAKFIINRIKTLHGDYINKEDIDYRDAFEKYLTEAKKSISMAKTILYGQTPHDLYSFFECMGINNAYEEIDTSDVNNILACGHKMIITGTGGMGKSMLMKHCFLNTIKRTNLIPVLVELRGLNDFSLDEISIENYVYHTLNAFGFNLKEKYYKYSLETGCYVFLFDGYDEVKNVISQKVSQEIIDFGSKYPDNYILVSSRPLQEFVGWSDFSEYSSMPLSKEQALSLISKLDYDDGIKKKFSKQLDESLYEKYYSFASNPLLLTIMLMTFEDSISIPERKTDFYEQAFSTLFHRHDAMKKGRFKREILSGLGYDDFKRVFSYFCFMSFFKNDYEFTEKTAVEYIARAKNKVYSYGSFQETDYLKDMTQAVCVLVREGLNYRFSHRSFQEYFAAVYATQLSDTDQKQFLISWLKSINGRLTTDFADILCDLQPDRFFKNILYDSMNELYSMYKSNNNSDDWFLQYMYSGVHIENKPDDHYGIYVVIKNSYLCTMFSQMLHYLHYDYIGTEGTNNKEKLSYVISELTERYGDGEFKSISFSQLIQDGYYDNVKEVIKWVFIRKCVVFDALENADINAIGRKRKFETMLDSL